MKCTNQVRHGGNVCPEPCELEPDHDGPCECAVIVRIKTRA